MRVGQKLSSAVDATSVVVIRAPAGDQELTCGGTPMHEGAAAEPGSGTTDQPDSAGCGTALGKRYVDDTSGVEVLCTSAGSHGLAVDGRALRTKESKPLPASD